MEKKQNKENRMQSTTKQFFFFLQIDDVTSVAVVNYMTTRLTDKSVY